MPQTQLVLVHGAWHGSWAWDPVRPGLEEAGYAVHAVDLPSHGADTGGLGGLRDDVAVVRDVLKGVTGPVVLVGHSYGGTVISEAAVGAADVRQLVYLTAFLLDDGQSLFGTLGGQPLPWFELTPDGLAVEARTPEKIFYNRCAPADAKRAAARIEPQSMASFTDAQVGAAWEQHPSTYLICEHDNAIPPSAQEAMASRAGIIERLDADHSPFLSNPDQLVRLLARHV